MASSPLSRPFRRPRRSLRSLRLAYGATPLPFLPPFGETPPSEGRLSPPFRYRRGSWRLNFRPRLPTPPFDPAPLLRRRGEFRRLLNRWQRLLGGGFLPYVPPWEWLDFPLLRRASKRVGGYRLTYGHFRPFSAIGPLLPPLPLPPWLPFSPPQHLRLQRLLRHRLPTPLPLLPPRPFLVAQRSALLPVSSRRALAPLRPRPRPPRPRPQPPHAPTG